MAARGRPRARNSIVDVVLPADNLTQMILNHRDLVNLSNDAQGVLQWLAQHGLIHNQLLCDMQ